MNNLSAFLHPVAPEPKEVIISERFLDDNGKPVPFKIRPLTQTENDAIIAKARKVRTVKGVAQEYVDSTVMSRLMVVAATVEPDFSAKELCDAYGVLDPTMVPGKMLLAGEYANLLKEINDLSGFGLSDVEEQAKN